MNRAIEPDWLGLIDCKPKSRRIFFRKGRHMRMGITIIVSALALTGCGQSELDKTKAENEELRAQVESLQGEISDIKEKAEALETSSGELRSQMDRFQSENWRDVVPDAQAASDQVESDQDSLKSSVDDADN